MKIQNNLISKQFSRLSAFFLLFVLFALTNTVTAQETVEINGQDVGSWFERNWMWVTGGVILLLLIIGLASRGSRSKKTTTIVKDTYGNVKSVTTTEEKA
jgi:protein-S-isoprenylcysteine O-methyltransferase Ste14